MKSKKITRLINGALMDEHAARLYYTRLINETNDPRVKKAITEIRRDEIEHFKELKRLQKLKGGKK